MAHLYFRYSSMNAGKSMEIMRIAYNYQERGDKVLIFNSALDTRSGSGKVASRTGMEMDAVMFGPETNLYDVFLAHPGVAAVLVDEVQFALRSQVEQLARIVDCHDVPVMCYGLKADAFNQLFPGSEALLVYADKLEEIKTLCWLCDRKATMVLRVKDGEPVRSGPQVEVGGNDRYVPVCRKCWHAPDLSRLKKV